MPIQMQIPVSAKKGLAALLRLSQKDAKQLLDALSSIPPRLRTKDIPRRIAGKVTVPQVDLREIVSLLVTLYSVREHEEGSIDQFVDALSTAIDQSDAEEFKEISKSSKELKSRLRAFLSLDESLGITSKALSVAYENPRHYHSARILTDVRPVFNVDVNEEPRAFVILHTLRFNVHENGEDKEWFVALNSVDLEDLKRTITRATKKEKTLKMMMRKTNATLLEWEE